MFRGIECPLACFSILILLVIGGCWKTEGVTAGVRLPADGHVGIAATFSYEVELFPEILFLPTELFCSIGGAQRDGSDETVVCVGATVACRYVWSHGFGPPRPGRWSVRLDFLMGGALVSHAGGNSSAWAVGPRLRFWNTRHFCVDLTYRWIPVDIEVSGDRITDLGGLEISVGKQWAF